MIVKIFDVSQGSCNLLISPTGRTEMIDVGCETNWSPVNHVYSQYIPRDGKLNRLVLTHHHGDHLTDWDSLEGRSIGMVKRRRLEGRYLEACRASNSQTGQELANNFNDYFSTWTRSPDRSEVSAQAWGMEISYWGLSISQADSISGSDGSTVNNCSFITLYNHQGTKILFAGDMEQEGMQALIASTNDFGNAVSNLSILIAPHHGHRSGFCEQLFEVTGRPWLVIASMKTGNTNVDTRYSSEENVKGINFGGTIRRLLTTRNDGAITIESQGQGNFTVSTGQR